MNEYKSLIMILKDGNVWGLIGLTLGLITYPEKLSLLVVLKYAICSIIIGSLAFYYSANSDNETIQYYSYVIATGSAWASYYAVKGITIIFAKFSINPIKTISDLFGGIRGKK
jgi:hypothetical protein